jgi:hypothetical protein
LSYFVLASTYFFLGMRVSFVKRHSVSRRDIRENLVVLMKKLLPNYGGSDIIDLMYQVNFDMKDDLFLNALDMLIPKFDAKSPRHNSESLRAFYFLCARAAHIEWQRGEAAKAFDYCIMRTKNTDVFDEKTFSILLSFIKGQPESEIIVFLNNLFDYRVPVKAHALAEGLQHEGFQLIFSYFVMQEIKLGVAAKKHFLQLLILNGNYEEAIVRALSIEGDSDDPHMIPHMIFLAVFCSDDMSLAEKYKENLTDVAHEILDCYSVDGIITNPSLYIPKVLHGYYSDIAFLGGAQKAARFLEMFSNSPSICFVVEGKYFIENDMFSKVTHSTYVYGMQEEDPTSWEIMMVALLRTGDFENALLNIKRRLNEHRIDQQLLNHLQTLTHCGNARVAAEAEELYGKHIFLYDEYVELDDLRRTGLVFDDFRKRDKQRFASLTFEDLGKELANDGNPADHITHMIALEHGAKIYEDKGLSAMALHCFMRLRVSGYKSKQTTENLARLFNRLGNKPLSRKLKELAETMPEAPEGNPIDNLPIFAADHENAGSMRSNATEAIVRPFPAKSRSGSKKPH